MQGQASSKDHLTYVTKAQLLDSIFNAVQMCAASQRPWLALPAASRLLQHSVPSEHWNGSDLCGLETLLHSDLAAKKCMSLHLHTAHLACRDHKYAQHSSSSVWHHVQLLDNLNGRLDAENKVQT